MLSGRLLSRLVSKNCLRLLAESQYLRSTMSQRNNHSVYVTRNVPDRGIEALKSAGFSIQYREKDDPIPRVELEKNIHNVDALFCLLTDKIDKELLDKASNLKVVGTMSVGYDHIDIDACKERGIKVGYTPDVLTHATAELTVALLLATSRRLTEGVSAVKDGSWGTWRPTWLCGPSLEGSTVGIFGFGRIGQQVMEMLSGFKVGRFIYSARSEKTNIGAKRVPFDELLAQSNFLIICCAFNESTKNLFNKDTLGKMKASSVLVNSSRGGVVNMDDLAEALQNGVIGAAGLDVTVPEPLPTDHKLLTLTNCVVLPHIGSATNEARSAMSRLTADNIIAALRNEEMPAQLV